MSESSPVAPQRPEEPLARAPLAGLDIVRFLTEIFAFLTFALWGFLAWPFPWNIVAGIAAPAAAILLWALFVSPKAVIPTHLFVRSFVELLIFASATIAWWSMGQTWIGIAFAVVAVTSGVLAGRRRLS
ncbi:YrdB family protein [Microbacterium sp. DT81.1]|uniref:YrdB family protein n=1 Tax=Microbacterium sp. DT81.1 TaxID=3393413 RepID=UPI003CE8C2F6